ncbi:Spindle assembly checkpoint component [Melia azedarach]|uniref:Spindle assembly checkpoint component n=1 Tax=Melia azedarach TaxID=155640 RepID=A0ACC1XB91_MELAZ|nr:Spindle assembly checkpoint component [Melia azedarach]
MAGTDPKKQLLTLIRDFASEKSQGERRVVGLKKRIEELQLELDAANMEREDPKRYKETTEQELKGYEVELALSNTAFQALESRISLIQDEISAIGSELEALKNEEGALRDGFISQMYELNAKIRTFQKSIALNFQKEDSMGTAAEAEHTYTEELTKDSLRTLEDMLAEVVSRTAKVEKEYLEEENIQKQVQPELTDLERKVSLMEMIMEETKSLQDLTIYPC